MRTVRQNRYDLRKTILDLKLEIEGTGYRLEAAEKTILHEDALQPYMQHHYTIMFKGMQWMHHDLELQMQQRFEFPHSFMVEWLGVGSFDNMMPEEQAEEKYDDDEEEEDYGLDVPEEADIEQSQRKIQDIDEFDILFPDNDLAVLERKIENLKHSQSQYVALDVSKFGRELQGQGGFQFQKQERKRMKRRLLSQLHDAERMTEYERRQIQDPWFLPMNQRWRLYRYWVHKYCKRLRDTVRRKENLYKEAIKKLKELQMVEDKQIFEDAAVIGMTTTAAARYQQALTELGPKIIVVEEAAEVLEGHIITTLSKKCEHLILIGDHKQLKPNPTVYKLAKRYNLDLSLFERMVNNGVHCDTLALQHRMRPEISCIMRHIYPDLQDHPCVTKYENVKGISSNVFFIDHTNPEEHDNDLFSHSNQYEADYIVALCDYLLKQGYDRSRITVLTTYSGQLFKLKKMMPKYQYEGLRLTVVDNYQGEENDIILLSLVRSNEMGSVGFLKIENRVCVALSRAKIGLFVIGNFELLAQNSQLWTEIWRDLRKKGQIGKTLHLYCQNHQADEGISVNSPEDFGKAPEGGCLKPCTFRLDCGHVCRLRCHPYDPQHNEYECRQPCLRSSCTDIKKHPCTRLCYQDCGDCMVKIKKLIPKCGHTQMVPCSVEPEDFSCQEACETILECGHRCGNACWMKHQCTQIVPKTFRCGHTGNVACATQDEAECHEKCRQVLKCGHICSGNCRNCHEGRLHAACNNNCEAILVCSHACKKTCSTCPPCGKECENRCPHIKCTKLCHEPCEPCKEKCWWKCDHFNCSRSCSEPCDRPSCNEPCQRKLRCNHPCIGLCGEPCPRQCRVCNRNEVDQAGGGAKPNSRYVFLRDCGHIVEVTYLDRYMNTESNEFVMKGCPFCNTPIRYHVRYGNVIKKVLNNIEKVKSHFPKEKIDFKREHLRQMIEDIEEENQDEKMQKMLIWRQGFNNTLAGLYAIENMLRLFDSLKEILDEYKRRETLSLNDDDLQIAKQCKKEASMFLQFIKKPRKTLSEQEESDIQNELLRHKAIICMMKYHVVYVTTEDFRQTELKLLKDILLSGKPFADEERTKAINSLKILAPWIPGFNERVLDTKLKIIHYPDLRPRCWSVCTKGHVKSSMISEGCVQCEEESQDTLWFSD